MGQYMSGCAQNGRASWSASIERETRSRSSSGTHLVVHDRRSEDANDEHDVRPVERLVKPLAERLERQRRQERQEKPALRKGARQLGLEL